MALAGDHARSERDSWREVATQLYAYGLAGLSVLLLFLFPPHFDLRITTIIQVAVVAAFLVLMERPVKTPAVSMVAPLTAVISASGVVFGAWTIVLAVVTWLFVRLRFALQDGGGWRAMLAPQTFGQTGSAIIGSYALLGVWHLVAQALALTPHYLTTLVTLLGIIAVGLAWQTASNVTAYIYYLILGRPFALTQLIRTGIIASVYAYLLVATYKFGGLLTTAIFYVVVAQIRVVQDVLGVTAQLHKLEKAQAQAQGLVRDLTHFTDTENVEFSREVQNISQMLGRHLGMSRRDTELLGLAAELHEIGKAHIPARIRSRAPANTKETSQKKAYARWGGLMIRAADALLPGQIADWIEFHGEHFDGSGYPRGLAGEDIPIASRIIAVARDYVRYLTGYDGTDPMEKEKALALLRDGSGTLYDPRLVTLLRDLVS